MKHHVRQWLAGFIYWGVMLASLAAAVDAGTKIVADTRNPRSFELAAVRLDAPPEPDAPLQGRALLVNLTGSKVRVELKGVSHSWLERTMSVPEQLIPEASGSFRPCGDQAVAREVEVLPGPSWWCFHQRLPTLDARAIGQLRNGEDPRLWFATLIVYRTEDGNFRRARLCKVYNFAASRFERSRRGTCDWFF